MNNNNNENIDNKLGKKRKRDEEEIGEEFIKIKDMRKCIQLDTKGYVVLPFLTEEEVEIERENFSSAILGYKEMKDTGKPCLGNNSAHNNPSSFHNEWVRSMRIKMHMEFIKFFRVYSLYKGQKNHMCQLFDKMYRREIGSKGKAKDWHANLRIPLDHRLPNTIFDGYLCLGVSSKKFICAPGTHKEKRHGIFIPFEIADIICYDAMKTTIEVPPGHILLFNQKVKHLSEEGKSLFQESRLSICLCIVESDSVYRTCYEDNYLIENYEQIISQQGVPEFPRNQSTDMYFHNNWIYSRNRQKLEKWSKKTFKDACLEKKEIKSGQYKVEKYTIVHKKMKSLQEYDVGMYEPYTEEEKSIFKLSDSWEFTDQKNNKVKFCYKI